jgi:aspartyl-tRNA(Asn)/glutamyl-tRNA(Gln) amidotransferase subunit B
MALPGVLPVLNRRAVEFAIRAGLAAGCEIVPTARWARKNYFYPDLPKGYQISMYEAPICVGGALEFLLDGEKRRVRLTRIHMEEDAGKNIHDAHADASLVDLNRAGVPLLEIVSEPDIRSPAEAAEYLRQLRSILQYLEVCDGNMEEGSLRCDANVSIRPAGSTVFGTRTEIKNMNSFRSVERALEHEIRRQTEVVTDGGTIVQETRLWDANREVTRSMRSKEFAHDYRYFPDPDLPPLVVDPRWVAKIRAALPELPAARRKRFMTELGLPEYDSAVLTARRDVADYFEEAVRHHGNAKAIGNWVMESVLRLVREQKLDDRLRIEQWPVAARNLAALVALIDDASISGKIAKTVFDDMVGTGKTPEAIVAERGLAQMTDAAAIRSAIDQVLAANTEKVAEYRGGKEKLFGFFVGQIMKSTQGKANPQLVNDILRERLAVRS